MGENAVKKRVSFLIMLILTLIFLAYAFYFAYPREGIWLHTGAWQAETEESAAGDYNGGQ